MNQLPLLVCDEFLARRLGAYAPDEEIIETGIGVLTDGNILIWPFVPDDAKDLNRRMTA